MISVVGFFSRGPKSIMPANLAALLAEWGQGFPPPGVAKVDLSESTDDFVNRLVFLSPEQMREAVDEIRRVGLATGGWTAYGAWELLNMTYTRDVPSDYLTELSEPRVRLIRSLNMPGYPDALCTADAMAWKRVFANDAGR